MAQTIKNPPAVQETWAQSLVWEDPLEKGMATHSSILAWRVPMDRGAWRATVHGAAKSQTRLSTAHILVTRNEKEAWVLTSLEHDLSTRRGWRRGADREVLSWAPETIIGKEE